MFNLHSPFIPKGDQPEAIKSLSQGIQQDLKDQVLMGCTGSGKTFTMANIIADLQKTTLIMAPNKTLAAQLYAEMKGFFPNNAVEYFVSYYDYYQPEAYVARTNTYIEKESSINEQIDRMRHSATRSLLERRDTIIVASVSCIYGIGDVETYGSMVLDLTPNQTISLRQVTKKLVELRYNRNEMALQRGSFRIKGDILEIFPSHSESRVWRISFFGDEIEHITEIDGLTGKKFATLPQIRLYANSHYVVPTPTVNQAIGKIKDEMQEQLELFNSQNKLIEAQRIEERTKFDLEMMVSTGFCSGIENYSRHLNGRTPGSAPPTLFEYLPKDSLLVVDESHIAVPQIGGMYKGDRARKDNLVEYGFRLPSCRDNRPLKFDEWEGLRPQTIFVSATPGNWELERTKGVFIEQIIRPTGLIDPICEIVSTKNQVDHLIAECIKVREQGFRVLVTTLTKKMSEALTEYLEEAGIRAKYLHSDIDTLERIEIIKALRSGDFEVLVGINLLREGLDIPECALVTILDADKEGFLRSYTSLIQTIGRAARNSNGRVIFYADKITRSMENAISETDRRRQKQQEYNSKHNIVPQTILKEIVDIMPNEKNSSYSSKLQSNNPSHLKKEIKQIEAMMYEAAQDLDFEEAAKLRDQLKNVKEHLLKVM